MTQKILAPLVLAAVALFAAGLGGGRSAGSVTAQERPEFLHALDDQPIVFDRRPNQVITPEVQEFYRTLENPYRGDPRAIAAGKKIYLKYCKACHLKSGKGRIGPSLVDDRWKYARTGTDRGKFEIIYAGGAGAMQAFGLRMDQDDILKVMAYLDVLGKQ